jgi:hypothetical protein
MLPRWETKTLIVIFFVFVTSAFGNRELEEPPSRTENITATYAEHEWWLSRWEDDSVECKIYIEHENQPTKENILDQCGKSLWQEWLKTKPCGDLENPSSCSGLYLQHVSTREHARIIQVQLPSPKIWVEIQNCDLISSAYQCTEQPILLITAQDPLPNEHITHIVGALAGDSFDCENKICQIPLRQTPPGGAELIFWALSSFGDGTHQHKARIRVIKQETSSIGNPKWSVNIISDRWRGNSIDSCAQLWNAFPPLNGLPTWLSTPELVESLATTVPYTYLAGRLIEAGAVDARLCPGGGLEINGYANACGVGTARSHVNAWQNRFDSHIMSIAVENNIPARLLKNIFAQETQFWPGTFNSSDDIQELGFGNLTSNGTDTLLRWNAEFFQQFCPIVLSDHICESGYSQLPQEQKQMLQGAVLQHSTLECDQCDLGIDLSRANTSIALSAQVLKANCEQVDQIIYNARGQSPGLVSNYVDLWRFTVVNYNAGPGCLINAINSVPADNPLTWKNIFPILDRKCPGAVDYVRLVSR